LHYLTQPDSDDDADANRHDFDLSIPSDDSCSDTLVNKPSTNVAELAVLPNELYHVVDWEDIPGALSSPPPPLPQHQRQQYESAVETTKLQGEYEWRRMQRDHEWLRSELAELRRVMRPLVQEKTHAAFDSAQIQSQVSSSHDHLLSSC
jgi:hypothetical protein